MGNSVLTRLADHAPVSKMLSFPRGRFHLHAMPTSSGYDVQHDPSYAWHGLKRGQTPFAILQHTVDGMGNLDFEGRRHRLSPGDTMLVLIPHDHRYWLQPGETWTFFWIAMTGMEALRIHQALQSAAGPVLRLQPDTVARLAEGCLDLVEGEGETAGLASAIAYRTLMAVVDDVFGKGGGETVPGDTSGLGRAIRHIESHLDQSISVTELARIAGYSRAHFTRAFTEREGMPPAEFALQARMRHAVRLLASHANMPIKSIAPLCGFDDPNYFAKTFRRFYGISPTEFRTTGMYAAIRPDM